MSTWRVVVGGRRGLWIGACVLALLGGGPLWAADGAAPLTPSALTIGGVLATQDGTQVLPAAAIGASLPSTATLASLAAGIPATATATVVATMTVTVDLQGAASGSFSGQAFVLYRTPTTDGGSLLHEAPLGLTVSVKQPGLLPLLVLCAGLLIGGALTFYRTRVLPRDQLLAQLGDVRSRLEADPELAPAGAGAAFRALADAALEDALTRLRQGATGDAEQAAARASSVVDLWQRQRDNWLTALAQQQELLKALPAQSQTLFLQAVRQSAADAARAQVLAALDDNLQQKDWRAYVLALQARLQALAGYKADFDRLDGRINAASAALNLPNVTESVRSAGVPELANVLEALRRLNPVADAASYATQHQALVARVAAVEATIPPGVADGRRGLAQGSAPDGADAGDALLAIFSAPLRAADLGKNRWPRLRLAIFLILSFVFGWVLLAGAGYNELYLQQATFGANPLGDYLGLFAWGFGAEASRDAITTLVRGWGLPARGE